MLSTGLTTVSFGIGYRIFSVEAHFVINVCQRELAAHSGQWKNSLQPFRHAQDPFLTVSREAFHERSVLGHQHIVLQRRQPAIMREFMAA